jgi:hypothetical protein
MSPAWKTRLGLLADFPQADAWLRSLELSEQRLTIGKVSLLRVDCAMLVDLPVNSVELTNCELSQAPSPQGNAPVSVIAI